MEAVILHQVPAATPIIFASVPGHDASSHVEALVARTNFSCTSVAMGSSEGVVAADQAINVATRNGSWVLLKNLHLASDWLHHLERRLRSLNLHPDFRLFLTMETTTSIPANIIETSRVVMNEPIPGIRANLLESLAAIRPDPAHSAPTEKDRLYFLLCWLHAVLLERSRYLPIGFTKSYGFNDSDLSAGRLMLDRWIGYAAKGRSNIDPRSLPWIAMQSLLIDSIYGGKVDDPEDQLIIRQLVSRLVIPDAFESGFNLTPNGESPEIVDINRYDQFVRWAEALPPNQPVSWLDLPPNSDQVVAATQGGSSHILLEISADHSLLLGRRILQKCMNLYDQDGYTGKENVEEEGE
jgi:dynein heavy chain 1